MIALQLMLALGARVAPVLIDAINNGKSEAEIKAELHAAAEEFSSVVAHAVANIGADDAAVLARIAAFRAGIPAAV